MHTCTAAWAMAMAALAGAVGPAEVQAQVQIVRLREPLGRPWTDELVGFPLEAALREARELAAVDEAGVPVPCQKLEDRVWFLVTLPADAEKTFRVTAAPGAARPAVAASATESGEYVVLDSGVMALRLPAGGAPTRGPLQGVRGRTGAWIGSSRLEAPLRITGRQTHVIARGPLVAEALVHYTFEGDKHYRFRARVIAGQPTAILDEAMDLNPGGRYALLSYANDVERSVWDWWNLDASENLHPAHVVFSFYEGLEPNRCRWMGHHATHPRKGATADGKPWQSAEGNDVKAYADLTYEADEVFNRVAGWWTNSFGDRSHYFSFYNDRRPETPVISLSRGRASRTVNPTLVPPPEPWIRLVTEVNDLRVLTKKRKDLEVVGPICLGSRQWLLSVEAQSALPPRGDKAHDPAFKAMLKYGHFPLDKVKEWTFHWPAPVEAWPRLFCRAGDLKTMQDRVRAAGKMAGGHDLSPIYRGETAEKTARHALERLGGYVNRVLEGTGHGGINWFHTSLHVMGLMPIWDAAMGTPGLDAATRARIQAYGAFLAHLAWDDDYWPPKETSRGWGSANMGTLASTARVLSACAVAGHPQQADWVQRSKPHLKASIGLNIAPDGSGISCPHYLGASAAPMLNMAIALKYGGGYDAFRDDPILKPFGRFMMDMLTPVDPRVNRRNLPPLGDTSRTEQTPLLDLLALGYAGTDEDLAGQLLTAIQEQGTLQSGALVPPPLMVNTTSKPRPLRLESVLYPGYGAFLRDGQRDESYIAYRHTRFSYDHFHADQGAFLYFAKGVPLMMDFGSMYSPRTAQGVYHNRIVWDMQEGPPRPCPGFGRPGCFFQDHTFFEHAVEPWTAKVEMFKEGAASVTDMFGEVKAFATLPAADFLMGQSDIDCLTPEPYYPDTPNAGQGPTEKLRREPVPPFSWQRRLLFVKKARPGQPEYLLVRDDFVGSCPPPTASFWVMAADLTLEDRRAHAAGQFGVDLELFVIQPRPARLGRWQFEHTNWGGERQLCVRVSQPEGKPFLTLLCPRRPTEPMPAVTPIGADNGVRIGLPEGVTEYAFLAPRPVACDEGDIRFAGTAGCIRRAADETLLVLAAAGAAAAQAIHLEAAQPASLRIQTRTLELTTNGPAQVVRLSGRLPVIASVTLDGRPADVPPKADRWELAVPAGRHTFLFTVKPAE